MFFCFQCYSDWSTESGRIWANVPFVLNQKTIKHAMGTVYRFKYPRRLNSCCRIDQARGCEKLQPTQLAWVSLRRRPRDARCLIWSGAAFNGSSLASSINWIFPSCTDSCSFPHKSEGDRKNQQVERDNLVQFTIFLNLCCNLIGSTPLKANTRHTKRPRIFAFMVGWNVMWWTWCWMKQDFCSKGVAQSMDWSL
jgi:hypothetical protein